MTKTADKRTFSNGVRVEDGPTLCTDKAAGRNTEKVLNAELNIAEDVI